MISTIILASLSLGALATQYGAPTCPCLTNIWTELHPEYTIACSWDWAVDGKCVVPSKPIGPWMEYPGDYGASCKKQLEPGLADCFNVSLVPPVEFHISEQADWCPTPWCFVDPCNCDMPDASGNDLYFNFTSSYSYATCGAKDTWTASAEAAEMGTIDESMVDASVGNAACTQASEDDTASDADSLQMGMGLMLAGLVGFA